MIGFGVGARKRVVGVVGKIGCGGVEKAGCGIGKIGCWVWGKKVDAEGGGGVEGVEGGAEGVGGSVDCGVGVGKIGWGVGKIGCWVCGGERKGAKGAEGAEGAEGTEDAEGVGAICGKKADVAEEEEDADGVARVGEEEEEAACIIRCSSSRFLPAISIAKVCNVLTSNAVAAGLDLARIWCGLVSSDIGGSASSYL